MVIQNGLVGRLSCLAGEKYRFPIENSVGDLLALVLFLAALFKKEVTWGGIRYCVGPKGRMLAILKTS